MTSLSVALVGNPNCGKTTVFNALTGASQRVGNWPGVTVERKSGHIHVAGSAIEAIDLPGIYSLGFASDQTAIDECIAREFILQNQADIFINIVDASHLERHLYLTIQLLEMGVPVILALNMMDVAHARHLHIDVAKLSKQLGCPVVVMEARKGNGIAELKHAIAAFNRHAAIPLALPYPDVLQQAINTVMQHSTNVRFAIRLLEEDNPLSSADTQATVKAQQARVRQALNEDADILLADTRYRFIQSLLTQCVTITAPQQSTWTTHIDHLILNRILGIPIFLGIIYCLFLFSINVGGALQDYFDIGSQWVFVDGVAGLLAYLGSPDWLIALLANGVGKGVNTIVTFIPVIGALFLFLAFLEDSGYMARAAFVVDRFMRTLGLPGKAFVPMIVGFGCNVPAVMAARTLENKRDQIITILMTPFMSCGARLAIYAVFTAAFFPHGGQNIVFALYLIGIAMAVLTGFILRHTLLKGDPAPLVMELPIYHVPQMRSVLLHAWQRLKGFVFRAGQLILPVCVIIGTLNTVQIDGALNNAGGDAHSLLSVMGQWITPLFSPMGIHADNWPATVGLVTGVLAKEVVVGTLNSLYAQMGHFSSFASMHADASVYGLMYQQFDGRIGAFAYLLFVLLYFPCVSTMAAIWRELSRGWAVFSACWSTGVAYAVAVVFYQAATYLQHPVPSLLWIASLSALFFGVIAVIRSAPIGEPA